MTVPFIIFTNQQRTQNNIKEFTTLSENHSKGIRNNETLKIKRDIFKASSKYNQIKFYYLPERLKNIFLIPINSNLN